MFEYANPILRPKPTMCKVMSQLFPCMYVALRHKPICSCWGDVKRVWMYSLMVFYNSLVLSFLDEF